MKVILNDDVKHLGELGDVKNVANGYARNYLFPRDLALPYAPETVAFFESRKAEIEERKQRKRDESRSLKEKLESLEVALSMPAGTNGKLYGAVTNHTIADFYSKNGFEIERKKIEVPGVNVKNVGNYSFKVHLYESTVAECKLVVTAQITEETKTKEASKKAPKAEKVAESKDEAAEAKAE